MEREIRGQSVKIRSRQIGGVCPLFRRLLVNYLEISDRDYGVQIRFSFPQILVWHGDHFGYVDVLRVTDVIIANNRQKAVELIKQRVKAIFIWEHRKSYDGIKPVILGHGDH